MAKEPIAIEQEIENCLDAREKLQIAIEDLNEERKQAEATCATAFAAALRTAQAKTVDLAVAKVNEWKVKDNRFGDQLTALEEMCRKITALIEDFKQKSKDNVVAVLNSRIYKLKEQRTEQNSETDALNKHIVELETELYQLAGSTKPTKKGEPTAQAQPAA